jgi:hypothetical protein
MFVDRQDEKVHREAKLFKKHKIDRAIRKIQIG